MKKPAKNNVKVTSGKYEPWEIAIIKKAYKHIPNREIAELLRRTNNAINAKIAAMLDDGEL